MSRTVEVPAYELVPEVLIDPVTTALIVVDMQNDFVKPEGKLFVPDAPATIPKIQHLLALAREHRMFTVFTQDTHYPGIPSFRSGVSTAWRGHGAGKSSTSLRRRTVNLSSRSGGTTRSMVHHWTTSSGYGGLNT